MSSLQIAKLNGKNHADELRDIRDTLEQVGIDAFKLGGVYLGGNGGSCSATNFPDLDYDKRVCLVSRP